MKRLCIYVTYDFENVADAYIGHMLQELRKVVDYLVVVCNYQHIMRGKENIQPFADEIFYRENTGLDAGAYRDVFCRFLGWDAVRGYDELLLVNDSFYGPVYPFGDLFNKMGKKDVDYWGMTRCPKGVLANGYIYESHVQSYFLALRKNVLSDDNFRLFWENMDTPLSLVQAVMIFEFGINKFLQESGYRGLTVMDLCSPQITVMENENPYNVYAVELIRDAKVPVLKRRSLGLENPGFGNAMQALKFIDNGCDYDTGLIASHLTRLGKGCSYMALDGFYAAHSKIYIYGAGLYGRKLAVYFAYKEWSFEKYIVTRSEDTSENCVTFDQVNIADNDGIIIAVGSEKAYREILNLVEKHCNKKQIFNPDGIIR